MRYCRIFFILFFVAFVASGLAASEGGNNIDIGAGYILHRGSGNSEYKSFSAAAFSLSYGYDIKCNDVLCIYPFADCFFSTRSDVVGWYSVKPLMLVDIGVGWRFKVTDSFKPSLYAGFGVGSYLNSEKKAFLGLLAGCDAAVRVCDLDGIELYLVPAFEYRRTSYLNSFLFGLKFRVSC